MVLAVSTAMQNALANAARDGIVPRDFVTLWARNMDDDELVQIGLWSGNVPVSAPVIQPEDGEEDMRNFVGVDRLMQVPAIPMTMKLEVRTVRLIFSNLSPDVLNATLVYNPKGQAVQIHRGLLNPSTMALVDAGICRFDGFVNRVVIKQPKAGNNGQIIVECQSHARSLALANPAKFSDEFFKRRGARQLYLDVTVPVVWGQQDKVHEKKRGKGSKWID